MFEREPRIRFRVNLLNIGPTAARRDDRYPGRQANSLIRRATSTPVMRGMEKSTIATWEDITQPGPDLISTVFFSRWETRLDTCHARSHYVLCDFGQISLVNGLDGN
ncbi:hypothetical protein I6F35_10385 [Bradyrhizobium sp. BRP22]|uniref:hypothetical protein n=1 Tax=Bradyrhizobium sp. BRP22 TaxID=2793821 RepID=UPI001CD4C95D|nr:hypothetical protein [Bradyrhizobium sp. BRP22]MCA1453616.1 hypothetical protein [Bradyrhizobium sp. BRP22]